MFRFFLLGALFAETAKAAPKAPENQMVAHIVQQRGFRPSPDSAAWTTGRNWSLNGTNSTTPTGVAGTASSTFSFPLNATSTSMSSACPLSIITSTTTVDVTFYITATTSFGSNLTSSSGTGTAHPSWTSSSTNSSSTTSCATWNMSSTSLNLSTGLTKPVNSSATTASTASESPCSDETATTSTSMWHNITTSVMPSQTTEPCDDDLASTTQLNSTATASSALLNSTAIWSAKTSSGVTQSTTPCDDEHETGSSSASAFSTSAVSNTAVSDVSKTAVSSAFSSGATFTSRGSNSTTSQTFSMTSSSLGNGTATHSSMETTTPTEPCEDGSSTVTPATSWDASATSSHDTSSTLQVIPTSSTDSSRSPITKSADTTPVSWATQTTLTAVDPIPTESCIIDTSMVPVTSAPLTSVPSSTLIPTKTVCQDNAPTGKPMPGNNHCGVHGLPVGNYFLARFVENSPGVRVTLEGCYQFCASVMNATDGCKSYRFYPERGLNVPRCDLYGSNVAYALDSIDNDHPDIWFDLTCDSPSDQKWAHLPGMSRLRDLGLLE
ncbi:hypothetical protein CGCSCA4_v003366 [Colletotrichum siamense]|uniref:Apple domain-containing protein n=1 Tax=Colletotrichum siamense TaxID=690259 RepID=A0A9P5EZK8_COLSI|nr:hypothetical protein CGCSCA4_v003366 [Colletotrichum siamense]KAF4862854.1 hypothetical protein CGCSCA2_v003417 [Colletotrichum siamense]